MSKKSIQKFKYLENEKNLKWNKKHFIIIFEGLSLKQIKKIFLEGESLTLMTKNVLKNYVYPFFKILHELV